VRRPLLVGIVAAGVLVLAGAYGLGLALRGRVSWEVVLVVGAGLWVCGTVGWWLGGWVDRQFEG